MDVKQPIRLALFMGLGNRIYADIPLHKIDQTVAQIRQNLRDAGLLREETPSEEQIEAEASDYVIGMFGPHTDEDLKRAYREGRLAYRSAPQQPSKCSNPQCPLQRAHSGPCAPKDEQTDREKKISKVIEEERRGWTRRGSGTSDSLARAILATEGISQQPATEYEVKDPWNHVHDYRESTGQCKTCLYVSPELAEEIRSELIVEARRWPEGQGVQPSRAPGEVIKDLAEALTVARFQVQDLERAAERRTEKHEHPIPTTERKKLIEEALAQSRVGHPNTQWLFKRLADALAAVEEERKNTQKMYAQEIAKLTNIDIDEFMPPPGEYKDEQVIAQVALVVDVVLGSESRGMYEPPEVYVCVRGAEALGTRTFEGAGILEVLDEGFFEDPDPDGVLIEAIRDGLQPVHKED